MNDSAGRYLALAAQIRIAAFGLCAVAFAVVGLAGLIIAGDVTVQRIAIAAALLGCLGQFIGQRANRKSQLVSLAASYCAFALVVWALFLL